MTGPVIDLSAQPMVNPCTTSGCGLPVRHLRPGGVVVVWETGWPFVPPRKGKTVRVRVTRPGCRNVGGDEMIAALIVTRHHGSFLAGAYLRVPGVAAANPPRSPPSPSTDPAATLAM